MIPNEIKEIHIVREPVGGKCLYAISSEDKRWRCEVSLRDELSIDGWTLCFTDASSVVLTSLTLNSLNYHFSSQTGEHRGSVKEAAFSVAGKSIVKDQKDNVIGYFVSGMKISRFLSVGGEELAVLKRETPKGLPVLLGPSKAHLVDHFVWTRTNPQQFDERLLYCFVCNHVISEKSRGGS